MARVVVYNPAPKRRKKSRRKPEVQAMAKKKRKRKRARRRHRASNPKRVVRRRKRRASANPRRRTARRRHRRVANPRRRRRHARRRHSVRAHMSNPRHRRRHGRRRHRRNPGLPNWAKFGLAALVGILTYGVTSALTFSITQRLDPKLDTLLRNRRILGGLAVLIGGFVGIKKSPAFGAAIAAAGAASAFGTPVALAIGKVTDKPMGAVYAQNMQGYAPIGDYSQLGAVYGQNMLGMGDYAPIGAVYAQNMQGFAPQPPWTVPNPFQF